MLVISVAPCPTGELFATGSGDMRARIWRLVSSYLKYLLLQHTDMVCLQIHVYLTVIQGIEVGAKGVTCDERHAVGFVHIQRDIDILWLPTMPTGRLLRSCLVPSTRACDLLLVKFYSRSVHHDQSRFDSHTIRAAIRL